MSKRRALIAFLVAPLVPAVLLEFGRQFSMPRNIWGVSSLLWSYPATLFIGFPAFMLFEFFGLRRLWHYISGGFLFTFSTTFLLLLGERHEVGFKYSALAGLSAFVGGLVASETGTFWVIAFGRSNSEAQTGPTVVRILDTRSTRIRWVIVAVVLLAVFTFGVLFRRCLNVDRCLDSGGRYNDDYSQCEHSDDAG
jgi:hypothetical protein